MPANTVKVDRTTAYGNPFLLGDDLPAEIAVQRFAVHLRDYFDCGDKVCHKPPGYSLGEWLKPLRGKNLACWCKIGAPCHADILLKLANA